MLDRRLGEFRQRAIITHCFIPRLCYYSNEDVGIDSRMMQRVEIEIFMIRAFKEDTMMGDIR